MAGLALLTLFPAVLRAIPLGAGVAVGCLIFLVAGRTLARLPLREPRRPLIGLVAVAVGTLLLAVGLARPLDLKRGAVGTPVLSVVVAIVLSAGACLLVEALLRFDALATRWVSRLGAVGLMVVLSHALVFQFFPPPPQGSVKIFAIVLVIPWVLAVLANLTSLSRALTGAARWLRGADAPVSDPR